MRKLVCATLSSAMLLSVFSFTACGKGEGLSRYKIDAEYLPEEQKLVATMEASIFNRTDVALPALEFQLWPNAYRENATHPPVAEPYVAAAYYGGPSYGGIEITSCEGAEITYKGEDSTLLVAKLPKELYPDERATLKFSFEVQLASINHRLGAGEHAVNLANFYPVLCAYGKNGFYECEYSPNGDPFVTDCADYDVTLAVPKSYTVAGAERAGEKGDSALFTLQAKNVRDVAFVLSEHFQKVETTVNATPVQYYYIDDKSPTHALGVAADSLSFYKRTFGDYDYPCYTVVQTDFPYGGMEYPMLSMISLSLREGEVAAVVAHETAHQWWYAMVGSDQYNEAWQDEGLAEYSVALFWNAHPQYGGSYQEAVALSEKSYRAFFSVYSQVSGSSDTRMSRPLTEYSGLYEYRSIAYDKGVILFDRVRAVAGERKVLRALSLYAKRYGGKIASAADLVACFVDAGAHVAELFTSFTEGLCVI